MSGEKRGPSDRRDRGDEDTGYNAEQSGATIDHKQEGTKRGSCLYCYYDYYCPFSRSHSVMELRDSIQMLTCTFFHRDG